MRISRIRIENFRNFKNIDVELGNIVTLIGENNSGKSNFLHALSIPLSSDDSGFGKRLSWYDINRDAKEQYYDFLKENRQGIIDGKIAVEAFDVHVPKVSVQLFLRPEDNEHYGVKDILVKEDEWIGGILYQFRTKKPEELLERVRVILASGLDNANIQMSLLPMELFEYDITVPGKGNKIAYDTLSRFRAVNLPAERDNFASNADRLGSRALTDLLQNGMTPDSQVKIEQKYNEFLKTLRKEGELDKVLNWQDYSSDIPNAQKFFEQINILPNMPQMSSILGSIRLGYENDYMFLQGLGHRNLVLMTVLLNSYLKKDRDISFRLMTVEEPEAHLCVSNILLMISLFNVFSKKNGYTQIVYSTHNTEFVNKIGLDKVIVMHKGEVFNLKQELTDKERDYLTANPNTDIFTLLYSKKTILVEGITEELLIKSYLQTRSDLNEIKVLSFHKGFAKIIDIWKRVNARSGNKLGIIRDFDDQPRAQRDHEDRQDGNVIVETTTGYTLETDITNKNYKLLQEKYGTEYGWNDMTPDELQKDWRNKKSDVMLRICHDLVSGNLDGFILPKHIQDVIDFMQGKTHES